MDYKFRVGVTPDGNYTFDNAEDFQDFSPADITKLISNLNNVDDMNVKFVHPRGGKYNWRTLLLEFVKCEIIPPESTSNDYERESSCPDRTYEPLTDCPLLCPQTLAAAVDISVEDKLKLEETVRMSNVAFTKALLLARQRGTYLQVADITDPGYVGLLSFLNNDVMMSDKYRNLLEQKSLELRNKLRDFPLFLQGKKGTDRTITDITTEYVQSLNDLGM